MHHGMGDFDARGKSIEHQSSNLVLKNRNQIGKVAQVLFGSVNRCRQVTFEAACNRQNLIAAGVPHQQRSGSKNLRVQVRTKKRSRIGFKKHGSHRETLVSREFRTLGHEFDGNFLLASCNC